jgi:hypothetical protein
LTGWTARESPFDGEVFDTLQEKTLHSLGCFGLGYAGAFIPDRVGIYQIQPADIAWVLDDTCFLLYCKDSLKKRERLDKKNFGQGKTWARQWSDTITMHGNNSVRSFDIKRSSIKNIIIISVLNDNVSHCIPHHLSRAYEIRGVVGAVSVPFSVLEALFSMGGNAVDLIRLCRAIFERNGIDKDELMKIFSDISSEYYELGRSLSDHNDFKSRSGSNTAQIINNALKNQRQAISPANMTLGLGICELAWIAGAIDAAASQAPNLGNEFAIVYKNNFSYFTILLSSIKGNEALKISQQKIMEEAGKPKTISVILMHIDDNISMVISCDGQPVEIGIQDAIIDLKAQNPYLQQPVA